MTNTLNQLCLTSPTIFHSVIQAKKISTFNQGFLKRNKNAESASVSQSVWCIVFILTKYDVKAVMMSGYAFPVLLLRWSYILSSLQTVTLHVLHAP